MELTECNSCTAMVRDIEKHGKSAHFITQNQLKEWMKEHEGNTHDFHVLSK